MTNDSSHSRRWLWLSIALVVLPALALWLVHSWLGWEGERLWQQAQARLKAEGETLDFMALVPKPVPDEDNFFAVEPLKDIALVVDGDETKGEPGARRARIEALKFAQGNNEGDRPDSSGLDHGVKWDAKGWADYYRRSERLPMPADSGNPGADILAGLSNGNDLYDELRSALNRPYSSITPVWGDRQLGKGMDALRLSHLSAYNELARLLGLRAQALVAANQVNLSNDDVRIVLRLAEGWSSERLMINALITTTLTSVALESGWSVLESRKLGQQELRYLDVDLARLDLRESMSFVCRGEMCFFADTVLGVLVSQEYPIAEQVMPSGLPADYWEAAKLCAMIGLWHLHPEAVAKGNVAMIEDYMLDYPLRSLERDGLKGCIESLSQWQADKTSGKLDSGVMSMIANEGISSYIGVIRRALQTQACLHQARLACALERYFLKHQRYPETLNELVPAFIDKVLLDPCDDQPMRYARTQAGRYKLWSLGFDGDDDGGRVIASPMDQPSHPKLSSPDYPGDWVWSYERLVPLAEE